MIIWAELLTTYIEVLSKLRERIRKKSALSGRLAKEGNPSTAVKNRRPVCIGTEETKVERGSNKFLIKHIF